MLFTISLSCILMSCVNNDALYIMLCNAVQPTQQHMAGTQVNVIDMGAQVCMLHCRLVSAETREATGINSRHECASTAQHCSKETVLQQQAPNETHPWRASARAVCSQ